MRLPHESRYSAAVVDEDMNRWWVVKEDLMRKYYLNGALMGEWDFVIMGVRWSERAGHSRHDAHRHGVINK